MKTTCITTRLFLRAFLPRVLMIFIVAHASSASAASIIDTSVSNSMVNYYNPPGSFVYLPDAGIHPDEREMKAGLLYDMLNKKIVWQKEMNSPYPIASLTKMMVAFLTVEDIHEGKIKWTDNVHWTREIVIGKGKRKRITTEDVNYSLLDIFKAAMIASNNEAAEQMAKYVGGDVQTFIDRMNTRARELSMNSTFFGNPTGLPSVSRVFDNSSTPSDLLILALEMLKYDEITQVTGMGYADISNGKSTSVIRNHNHLTIDFKGEVDGMKTGYTKRAGFCLVATSNKCNQRLISVVLGARSPNLRNDVVKNMINEYYCSIGLDKLGPYCESPLHASESLSSGDENYRMKTIEQTYVVKRGDDIGSVAYQFNCSPSDIKTWNKLRTNRIAPGKKLTILSSVKEKISVAKNNEEESEGNELAAAGSTSAQNPTDDLKVARKATPVTKQKNKVASAVSVQAKSKYIIHIVQPGDTLTSIARRYDITNIAQLKAVNKISKAHLLRVGSKIRVPVNS